MLSEVAMTYGMLVFCYVNNAIKLPFFISRVADPCVMFYQVIVYRIVDFISFHLIVTSADPILTFLCWHGTVPCFGYTV